MTKVTLHKSVTVDRIMALCEDFEQWGVCVACGADCCPVEPDARRYECEACGERTVYGAEELLLRGWHYAAPAPEKPAPTYPKIKPLKTPQAPTVTPSQLEQIRDGMKKHKVPTACGHVLHSTWYQHPYLTSRGKVRKSLSSCIEGAESSSW